MKLLVLGASGMMGHVACRDLRSVCDVEGTYHSPVSRDVLQRVVPDVMLHPFDCTDHAAIARLLRQVRPDVVLNAVGLVKQLEQAKDPVLSIQVNALFPHVLANACDQAEAKLIHLSTDCVFSGRTGMYTEDCVPDPEDLYGRTKLLGEVTRTPHLTLRTSIIGRQLTGSSSLIEWFLSQRGKNIRGFRRAIYSGLTTRELARVLARLLDRHRELTGLYHVASTPISKFDLLSKLNQRLESTITIEPDNAFHCDRSLDGARWLKATGIAIGHWEDMLDELVKDIENYDAMRCAS